MCLSGGAICWLVNTVQILLMSRHKKTTPPCIQDGDFRLLHPGEPLFQTFSGQTLSYRGKKPLYPFFINECAYYEKSIALSLARRRTVVLPPIRVQTEKEQVHHKEEWEDSEEDEEEEMTSEEDRRGGEDEQE